jgi:phosphate transport system permease protein
MNSFLLIAILLVLTSVAYAFGQRRARTVSGGQPSTLHSRPQYYGLYVALWCGIPSLALIVVWLIVEPHVAEWMLVKNLPADAMALSSDRLALLINDIENLASGNIVSREIDSSLQAAADGYTSVRQIGNAAMVVLAITIALAGLTFARRRIVPTLRARNLVERSVTVLMIIASMIAVLTTVGIVLSLLFETLRFFQHVPVMEFLFGLNWSPQTALRADQVGASGAFGAVPLFAGTLMITFIAMCVAVPIGLFSAIYMSEYAPPEMRAVVKPMLEILAGVPTVVYGFFAALTVAPFIRNTGESIGLDVSSESALAAGMVMGIMIIPFVSSLSDDLM